MTRGRDGPAAATGTTMRRSTAAAVAVLALTATGCGSTSLWANPHHYHKLVEVPTSELQPAYERAEKHLRLDAAEAEVTVQAARELEVEGR
jgi:hypothetical protein